MEASHSFRAGPLVFGAGRPKICIPLVSPDLPSLLRDAQALASLPHDLVEWRVDCFAAYRDKAAVQQALQALRGALGATPLLFTFRTEAEGGKGELTFSDYCALNRLAAAGGLAQLVDVELFSADEEDVRLLVSILKAAGAGVVVSNHDFEKTPSAEEIVRRLLLAKSLGADLPKAAVMPRSREDILALLSATVEANRRGAGPLITMSMGALGGVSRLCGQVFGSAVTFGCAGQASAPGQFPAEKLEYVLDILNASL